MENQCKKNIKIALIITGTIFVIGVILLGLGQMIPHVPLFIAGCVVAGVGFIPLIIVAIIAYLKQG